MLFAFLALIAAAAARSIIQPSISTRPPGVLPSAFKWFSTGPLIAPKNDTREIKGIKDPSIIYYNDVYHVFASTAKSAGYNLVYFNFTSFDDASNAPFFYLDQSAIGEGYRAAPQVFYFEPQKLWYLVFQDDNSAYSTNADISNPAGWTAPKHFYDGTPKTIADGLSGGYWVDMWVICDETNCHLFSSDDNGRLYRSQTPVGQFPEGMSEPVIAMQDEKYNMFEASNVYSVGNGTYLLLVECIGSGNDSGGRRYFRSWTASDIAGPWTALAATESNPFMGAANVAFNGTTWTKSISHGEMIRTQVDQKMRISPCNMRYLYQGMDPSANTNYNALPWRLGLLTQIDSAC